MAKPCKLFLLAMGLLLTTNGWSFIFKIDHYVNNDGQHIYLFADMHMLIENGIQLGQPNNQQRNAIVKAAIQNEAFVIAEDPFPLINLSTRDLWSDSSQMINNQQKIFQDLITNPKTFDRNTNYSSIIPETFFNPTNISKEDPITPCCFLVNYATKRE